MNVPYPHSIRWMGHSSDFSASLKEIDILLLTSRDDPSPLVVFEALASGRPAFAFASTGFNEMLPREFVALDTEHMIELVLNHIKNFEVNYLKYRSIAEEYSILKFKDRAFRSQHSLMTDIPLFKQEVIDIYGEKDLATLDQKRQELIKTRANLIFLMKSIQRKRNQVESKVITLERVSKECDVLRKITQSTISEFKIEHFRATRKAARDHNNSLNRWFQNKKTQENKLLHVLVIGNGPSVLERCPIK